MAGLRDHKVTKNTLKTITDTNTSANTIEVRAKPHNDLIESLVTSLGLTGAGTIATNVALMQKHEPTAINATATATAAQVKTGYITSTSASPVTITLPTGTLLGAELGAVQGTIHELYIDNTAGAQTITVAVATNGILSALAAAEAGGAGLLTVPSGVTGQARFTLMFSSATAYTFTRTA